MSRFETRFNFATVFAFVGIALAMALQAGCAAPGRTRLPVLELTASSPDRVSIRGEIVPASALGRKLRSLGANRHTRIMLNLTQNADPATGALLRDRIVYLGYPKVVIARKHRPKVGVQSAKGAR